MRESIKFWLACKLLSWAVRLQPEAVLNTIRTKFIQDMFNQGVVRIELGFNDDGDPAIRVQTMDSLPRVTKH